MQLSSNQFSFDATNKIWKVLCANNHSGLLLEVRNDSEMEISYALVDFENQKYDQIIVEESNWWSSIVNFSYPYFFIELFTDPQDPVKKQMIVYDLEQKKVLQEISDFQFVSFQNSKLVGHSPGQPNNLIKFEFKVENSQNTETLFPLQFENGSDAHRMVAEYLEKDVEFKLPVEYLELKDYIIISYFDRLGTNFARKLLVVKDEEEFLHVELDYELRGYAAGGFFIHNQMLIYIEKSRFLNGFKLY